MTFFFRTRQFLITDDIPLPQIVLRLFILSAGQKSLKIHIFHGKRGDFFFFQCNLCSRLCLCSVIYAPVQDSLHSLTNWRHQVHPMGKHSISAQSLFSSIHLLKKALIYLRWGKQQKGSTPRRAEHRLHLSCSISPAVLFSDKTSLKFNKCEKKIK